MIYSCEHYSTAMLEKLVHGSGSLPPNQPFVEITIPNGISYEVVTPAMLPGWEAIDCQVSKAFGEEWQQDAVGLDPDDLAEDLARIHRAAPVLLRGWSSFRWSGRAGW
jgi:RES domain-containing protein